MDREVGVVERLEPEGDVEVADLDVRATASPPRQVKIEVVELEGERVVSVGELDRPRIDVVAAQQVGLKQERADVALGVGEDLRKMRTRL